MKRPRSSSSSSSSSAPQNGARHGTEKGHARHPQRRRTPNPRPASAKPRRMTAQGYGVLMPSGGLCPSAETNLPAFFSLEASAVILRDAIIPVIGEGQIVPLRITIERVGE